MTPTDVLFRYAEHPLERTAIALGRLSEVYGIRHIRLDEAAQQVRVEYDVTHINKATVQQLLRRTGLDIVEELPLIPAQPTIASTPPTQ